MKLNLPCAAVITGLFAAFSAYAQTGNGPSFACPSPGYVETTICNDAKLSAMDRDMAALYPLSRTDILGAGPSGQQDLQRAFLKDRATSCADGTWQKNGDASAAACMTWRTDQRLAELAVAAFYSNHDLAMRVLSEHSPAAVPFYNALYAWTTIDDLAKRNAAVTDALPKDDPDAVTAALASDQDFGDYLINTVVQTDGADLSLPCGALTRRPGLTTALQAKFGSTMDSMAPMSDCGAMLPQAAGLNALGSALWDAQPDCEGTIRFGYYRDFDALETAIQLHQMQYVQPAGKKAARSDAKFRMAHAKDIATATAGLVQLYGTAYRLPAATAQSDANIAVDRMVHDAFDSCDD